MFGVDAFTFLVQKDGLTLLDVAEEAQIHASDLLEINSELMRSSAPFGATLEKGSLVRLPIYLRYRGSPHGRVFVIQEEESRLQRLDQSMKEKIKRFSSQVSEEQLKPQSLALPKRKLKSKAEQLLEVVYREAEKQVDRVIAHITPKSSSGKEIEEEESNALATKHIHHFVDVSAVKKKGADVEEAFSSKNVLLHSFKENNQSILHLSSQIKNPHEMLSFSNPQKNLPSTSNRTEDNEDHHCVDHTHRWEFSFCKSRSKEVQETWAVLSCQHLSAIAEVFQCPLQQSISHVKSFFFFAGGTFYVDGEEDLSDMIRHFDPGATTSEESWSANPSFSRCEVKLARSVTFGELKLRIGEVGVYRHIGCCDHYFFLQGVTRLSSPMQSRNHEMYPCLLSQQRKTVIRCFHCKKFPSTISLYKKSEVQLEAQRSEPTYLCDLCHEYLIRENEVAEFIKVVPPVSDEYFTC